jgi:predicted Zn-dependent protease
MTSGELLAEVVGDLEVGVYLIKDDHTNLKEPIDARALLKLALGAPLSTKYVLIVTDRDLRMRSLDSLFGFAIHRKRIAVVSTARLQDPCDPNLTQQRLCNITAHELGHLIGLTHCHGPQCVMLPATTPAEIDRRPLKACGRCPRRMVWMGRLVGVVAALMILAFSAVAIDRASSFLASPVPDFPFL